jgi:hypothetical protein
MTSTAISTDPEPSNFFRFAIESTHSQAMIRVGRRRIVATVQEASIDGFTIVVAPKYASRLKVGKHWILDYDGVKTEVHPLWFFNTPEGNIQLGLHRLRDLKPPDLDRHSLLIRFGGARFQDPSFSAAFYGGIVLSLVCLLALPGYGEHVGTSDGIQNAFRFVLEGLNDTFGKYL